jgi:hypothetical protein
LSPLRTGGSGWIVGLIDSRRLQQKNHSRHILAGVRLQIPGARPEKFIRAAEPRLYYHIPQEALVAQNSAASAAGPTR